MPRIDIPCGQDALYSCYSVSNNRGHWLHSLQAPNAIATAFFLLPEGWFIPNIYLQIMRSSTEVSMWESQHESFPCIFMEFLFLLGWVHFTWVKGTSITIPEKCLRGIKAKTRVTKAVWELPGLFMTSECAFALAFMWTMNKALHSHCVLVVLCLYFNFPFNPFASEAVYTRNCFSDHLLDSV